jgi:hypothetical protein
LQRFPALAVLALGAGLVLVGCGGSNEPVLGPTAGYMPAVVGNEWHYDQVSYTAGAQTAGLRRILAPRRRGGMTTAQTASEEIISITDTTTIGGSTWHVATLSWVGGTETEEKYLRHDAKGLLWKDVVTDPGYYRLLAPLTTGHAWADMLDPAYTYRITDDAATVGTPAGTFFGCVVVEQTYKQTGQPDEVSAAWFAPNVGLVKEELHTGTNLDFTSELKSYELFPSTAAARAK